jgi:flagellar hook protein FlgE
VGRSEAEQTILSEGQPMTISSSLNVGVAGLSVNASRLATISDNIANSATYGYKRAVADFASIVLSESAGRYVAGGVRTDTFRLVDQAGSLITTDNSTDIAIGGRGMLPVTSASALNDLAGDPPFMLTTTGSFRPDAEGYLRTASGLVLLGWPANTDGTLPTYPRDSAAGLEPVRVSLNQYAADPTTNISLGINLPATATQAGASGQPLDISVEYFDNLGASQSLTITYTPTVPGSGSSNLWTMDIADSATGPGTIASFTLEFDGTRGSGGTLLNVTPVSGGTYNAATGELDISVGGGPMTLEIGEPGSNSHMTQLSADFAPVAISKDGSPVGNLSSVEIDENGMLQAVFDTGLTRVIYQIPVADVPNPNGLAALDNQAFRVTPDSGDFYLWDAGDGPTGETIGFAREESTTDIAGELTQLIQTQRAYSSNAKIIQTVDEMLQETTNIKR